MYTIYQIINNVNQKSYIGWTSGPSEKRWNDHKLESKRSRRDNLIYKAMRKYGIENFSFEILKQGDDTEWGLKVEEPYYIALYQTNTRKWGYNMTAGGDGTIGYKCTEKAKAAIGRANKNRVAWNKGKTGLPHKPHRYSDEELLSRSNRARGNKYGSVNKGKPGNPWKANKDRYQKHCDRMMGNSYTLGRIMPEEEKMSHVSRPKGVPIVWEKLTCPHCGKTGIIGNMKRWHFDKCKKLLSVIAHIDKDEKLGPKYPSIICEYCGVSGGNNVMKRWHFDRCKQNYSKMQDNK